MHVDKTPEGDGLTVLWIGQEPSGPLRRAVREVGLGLAVVSSMEEARALIASFVCDVVVVATPSGSTVEVVRAACAAVTHAWVVAMVGDTDQIIEAVAAGAHDAVVRTEPADSCRWLVSCARAAVSGCDRSAAIAALATRTTALSRRVAALGRENQALRELSAQDHLTGLVTPRGLDTQLRRAVSSGGRYGHSVAMILCDVDGLARVNEERGRPEGDATLRRMARVLAANVRGCDLAARRGDDEFAVILPSTSARHAVVVAERIRINAEREIGGGDRRVTISVGVAAFEPTGVSHDPPPSIDGLFESAYRALRLAKRKGKNRVESATSFYDADDEAATPIIPRS